MDGAHLHIFSPQWGEFMTKQSQALLTASGQAKEEHVEGDAKQEAWQTQVSAPVCGREGTQMQLGVAASTAVPGIPATTAAQRPSLLISLSCQSHLG